MHRICLICDKAQVECLTHFVDGMCISDRVSLSPLFSNTKRRQIFLSWLIFHCFPMFFCALECTFRRFFLKRAIMSKDKF